MIEPLMRKLLFALAAAAVLTGCPTNAPNLATPIEEDASGAPVELTSSINVADPRAEDQFLRGFHQLEQGAWRWTERVFSLILAPPPPASSQAVSLEFRFTVPEVVFERVGAPLTLSATVNGTPVGAGSYDSPGEHFFAAEVPADALGDEPARVEFELDKAMPPSGADPRELGVVALSIALK